MLLNAVGIEPDLILAEGNNGNIGYVRADDLEGPIVNSPEEAAEYMESLERQRVIPIYQKDGSTVIDTFTIDNSQNVVG